MIIEENHLPDVRGLAKVRVDTEAEALRWFFEGEKARTYGHHFLNPVTSPMWTAYLSNRKRLLLYILAVQSTWSQMTRASLAA